MKLSTTLSLLALAGMNLSGCISGPSSSSAPAQGAVDIDQVPATAGAMPLALNGADVNQSQGSAAPGGFAVTSLGGQVYVPKHSLKDLSSKVPAAEKILASEPGNLQALKTLAYNALAAGSTEKALGYLRIASDARELDDEALNILGVAYFFESRDGLATETFLEASKRNARNPIPSLNLGLLKQKKGSSLDAILYFKRAIAADPKNVLGYLHAGNAAYTNKQYKTASDFLKRALEVSPSNALAYYNLGVVYHYGLRDYGRAKASFRSVIDAEDVSNNLRDLARGMLANVQREET